MLYNLSTGFIIAGLTAQEILLTKWDKLLSRGQNPKDTADLNFKVGRVCKRLELAFRSFLHAQPRAWKIEQGLTMEKTLQNPDKELISATWNYYVSSFSLCFHLIVAKKLNPEMALTPGHEKVIDRFGQVVAKNFRPYLDQALSLYYTNPTN